jgi:hypothetical protein
MLIIFNRLHLIHNVPPSHPVGVHKNDSSQGWGGDPFLLVSAERVGIK